ncbi:MAG: hypothetical protein KAG53_06775 [Endozoicomonadaceae bacterium]|nr:hypothetical protein [Endozoicomonadaceae bacterium]
MAKVSSVVLNLKMRDEKKESRRFRRIDVVVDYDVLSLRREVAGVGWLLHWILFHSFSGIGQN